MSLFSNHLKLGKSHIGLLEKPYLIAEIGLNHNKDLELAKRIIQAAARSGANAVKFQSYTTEKFIHPKIEKAQGLFSIFKDLELNYNDHEVIIQCAKSEGVEFLSTPLSNDWVEKLFTLGSCGFKIASGDINNFSLLKAACKFALPLIVSTGAAHFSEIERLVAFLQDNKKTDVILLHCVSLYPAAPKTLNLATISQLSEKFACLAGFSDHSIGADASFAAVSLGATVIEKHFTLDNTLPGPDQKLSANPEVLKEIRQKIDLAFSMRGEPKQQVQAAELQSDEFGKRSLYNIEGEVLALRPRDPLLPKDSDYFENIKIN